MNIFKKNRTIAMLCALAFGGLAVTSCTNQVSDQEIAELQQKYDSIMEQYENLRSANPEYDAQTAEKDSLINVQAAEIQRLIKQLEQQKQNSRPASALSNSDGKASAENQQLKKDLKDKEATVKDLQKRLDQQAKELQRLQNSVDNGKTSKNECESLKAQLKKQISEQESEINTLRNQIKNLNATGSQNSTLAKQLADCQNSSKALGEKNTALTATNGDLNRQVGELTSINASLADQLNAQKSQNSELNSQIAQLQGQVKTLDAQVQAIRKSGTSDNDAVKQYQSQVAQLQSQVAQLQESERQLQNQVSSLQSQSSAVTASSDKYEAQIKNLNAKIGQLNAQLDEKDAAITAKEQQIAELYKAQKNLGATNESTAKIAALNKQVNDLNGEIASLNTRINALEGQLAEAKRNEAATRESEAGLQSKVAAAQERENSLQNQLADAQSQLKGLQAQMEILEKDNARLNAANNDRKSSTSAADAKTIADLQQVVADQKTQISKLQNDLKEKETELANAKKAGANTTRGNVNQKLAELQALCDSYAAEIERLRAENQQLKAENSDLRQRLDEQTKIAGNAASLSRKIIMASVLVVNDLTVTPGKSVVSAGTVKATNKADQVMVASIKGQIMKNNVIDPGAITVYARITNAKNRVIVPDGGDEYTFTLSDGTPMQYSMKQDIEYTGAQRPLSMMWRKPSHVNLEPGLYWVTLYVNGFEIGKTSFKLD